MTDNSDPVVGTIPVPASTPPPRPTRLTREALLIVARKVIGLVNEADPDMQIDIDEMIEDLIKVAGDNVNADGYDIAHDLERRFWWAPNAAIVEALDEWSSHASDALHEMEKAWAAEHNIQPPHPIGTMVSFHGGRNRGEITGLSGYHAAKYEILADNETQPSRRYIAAFELVTPIGDAGEPTS